MAKDDKDSEFDTGPGSSDAGETNNKAEEPGVKPEEPRVFVDRDDDQALRQVDSDYEPGFPGVSDDDETPDPGYAAFAGELEDPLMDWPAPETTDSAGNSADNSPRNLPDNDFDNSVSAFGGENASGNRDTDRDNNDIHRDQLAVFDDDRNGVDDTPAPAMSAEDMHFADEHSRSFTDSDSNSSNLSDGDSDDPASAAAETREHPPTPPRREEAAPPPDDVPAAPEEDFDDEFIDDFLNDLDAPEDSEGGDEDPDPFDDEDAEVSADIATAPGTAAAGYAAYATEEADIDEDSVVKQPAATSAKQENGDTGERSLPLGMIVVVLVALALLAVGGYGVVQQRGELQAEIRDLQSKLATAPSTEEAEVERERQRQMALENESLGAELEALAAENSALAAQLSSLEEQLAERSAQAEAAEAEAKRAAAAASAAKKAATPTAKAPAARTAGATQSGPWFVNFGSYAQRDVADRWAGKLAVEGGQVVVQTATAAGKTLYRVRVVGLATQDAAERVATSLEREYRLPRLWVGKN